MRVFRLLSVAALCSLCACSSTLLAYKDTLSYAYFGTPDASFTSEQILNYPKDLVYVSLPGKSRASLEQALAIDGTVTWRSGDKGSLVFHHQRLVRTTGFAKNLLQVSTSKLTENMPISALSRQGAHADIVAVHDDARYALVQLKSTVIESTDTVLSYDGLTVPAIAVVEELESNDKSLVLKQYYWFSKRDATLLRSIQQPTPAMPPVDVVFISELVRQTQTVGTH